MAYDLAHAFATEGHRVYFLCQGVARSSPERELDGQVAVLRYKPFAGTAHRWPLRHAQHAAAAQAVLERYLPEPPDIVHGHTPLQYLAARHFYGNSGRWYYTFHSPAVEEMRLVWGSQGLSGRLKLVVGLPLIRRMESEILEVSTALIAESDYTCSLLAKLYGAQRTARIEVIAGWTHLDRFRPLNEPPVEARTRLGWPRGVPVLFTLRRLESRMGLDNLLHAYRILRESGYRFHAVIGGKGSQERHLVDLRRRLGLENWVTFIGHVPEESLALAYGSCDAFVIPSAQLECFGLIALEALACGRPVLVTPVGALPEVMQGFQREWIGASATPVGIAALIGKYLDGALPGYNDALVGERLEYYSFARAFREYTHCLFPTGQSIGRSSSENGVA